MANELNTEDLRRLPKGFVKVGEPTRYPIFDKQGTLLLNAGTTVSSQNLLEKLYERGLYQEAKVVKEFLNQTLLEETDSKANEQNNSMQKVQRVPLDPNIIPIGESIFISPLTGNYEVSRFSVKYIGSMPKKGIFCTQPELNSQLVILRENMPVKVQIFTGKDIYTFNSYIDSLSFKPFPYFNLKYPPVVEKHNLRKNQRVQSNIIATIQNKSSTTNAEEKIAVRISDMSLGGSMLELPTSPGVVGDEIEMAFKIKLDEIEPFINITGEIRSINQEFITADKSLFKVGIRFKSIPAGEKALLQNYIYQLITGIKLDEI